MTSDGAKPEESVESRSSIGAKPFAYDVNTRERVFANEAKENKAYRVREGFCFRVNTADSAFFRFYPEAWHISGGFPPPPRSGGESPAHEEAIIWILKNKRFGAATKDGPFYASLESAEEEFWTGSRRADLTAIVAECWPRIFAAGTKIYIEIHVTHAVGAEKLADLLREGTPTIELSLDKALRKISATEVLVDKEAFTKKIARELVRCPDGQWIVSPRL